MIGAGVFALTGSAAGIARAIARPNHARADVAHVSTAGDEDVARDLLESAADSLGGVDVHTRLLTEGDAVDTLVAGTAEYDVTVAGARRESLLDRLVFGAIPEEVGRRAESTVIMAKRHLGIASRLTRWVRGYSG